MKNNQKIIDYKKRIKDAFEAIIIICDKKTVLKPSSVKSIRRISEAQLKHLEFISNKIGKKMEEKEAVSLKK